MKVKQILLKNLGPIEDLTITARSFDGKPVPIVLVGQNGAGKSLFLSTILDAMTEARRGSFRKLPEVSETDYLRLSQKAYVRQSCLFSHAQIIFEDEAREIIFDDVVSKINFQEFQEKAPAVATLPGLRESEFSTSGFFKRVKLEAPDKIAISETSFLYFPFFRYEIPAWMSGSANIDFARTGDFYGTARINPIRSNVVQETSKWILNLVLDRELYEKVIFPNPGGAGSILLGYDGPNHRLINLLNLVLTSMMKAKDPTVVAARFGIARKGNRGIAIHVSRDGEAEQVVASDLELLSSGELMCFGMAAEIVRGHELIKGKPPENLEQIRLIPGHNLRPRSSACIRRH